MTGSSEPRALVGTEPPAGHLRVLHVFLCSPPPPMCHPDADHFCRRPHACSGARDALPTDAARSTCYISRREQRLRNFLSELNFEPAHAPARETWSARKRSLFSVMETGDESISKRCLGHIWSGVSMKTAVDERRHETRSLFEVLSSFTST